MYNHFLLDVVPYYFYGNEATVGSDGIAQEDKSTWDDKIKRNELYFKLKDEKKR